MLLSLLLACAPDLPTKIRDEDTGGCADTWYRDTDGDGVGDATRGTASGCEPPEGYVEADGDCDDLDATLFPGAVELCDSVDQDCDGEFDEDAADAPTWYADVDGDGFGDPDGALRSCEAPGAHLADASDCDDRDAAVFPGAPETCDGVDQDCDGAVDEDPVETPTWYTDADGDGWGDTPVEAASCEAPAGTSAVDGDCDDADPLVFPDAAEVCDGADDDCDGLPDEDATDAARWYADADGDTYGDAAIFADACEAPAGHVPDDTDCDDTDATVFPGATERCGGVDEDCDGAVDEGSAAPTTWYADADGDGFGDAGASVESCLAPAGYVDLATDCDDADPSASPAGTEVCGGGDEDCDGAVDEGSAAPATFYADADGDGFGDPLSATSACSAPAGHVADATDCDDADALVSPSGTEVCGGGDEDCDGATDTDATDPATWYADADGDGFGDASSPTLACDAPPAHVADATDCDDTDALVSPAGTEVCGGGDEDCDGVTDTDATDPATWYADADGDGFGDAAVTAVDCVAPASYVAEGTDCDDADPAVSPAADELCGGGDEDCDGTVDEDEAIDATTWYRDADVDGRGDPDTTVTTCVRPYGYLADDSDCDDTDPAVHPGMTELCATAYDDNCDGITVEVGAADCVDWFADADLDGAGDPDLSQCQCEGDASFPADNGDDCDDSDATVYGGAPEVWGDGVDQSCDGDGDAAELVDDAVALLGVLAEDLAGSAVNGGDFDGDGLPDLVVGAPSADVGGTNAGEVYVWFGAPTGSGSLDDADLSFEGVDAGDRAGSWVGGGDVDGDGLTDLVVGAPEADTGGVAYVLLAPDTTSTLAGADVTVSSSSVRTSLGSYVGLVGDLDGDGADELVVGDTNSTTDPLYLYAAPSGALGTADATVILTTATAGGSATNATRAGDLDGDGVDDLVVGAPGLWVGSVPVGGAFVFYGLPADGSLDMVADARLEGVAISEEAGTSVAPAGDIDGDGLGDLLVGAPGPTHAAGLVYLVTDLATADLALAHTIFTGAYSGALGTSVAGGGDVDGDGTPDLVLGEPFDAFTGASGAVHVVLDIPTGTVTLDDADASLQGTTASNTGGAVHLLGDADGDGLDDLLLGAWHDDVSDTDAGAAWFVAGR